MKTEYAYDPDFPYVVKGGFGYPYARFNQLAFAVQAAAELDTQVIDTTPKPKIPEDAEFIYVADGDQSLFAKRAGVMDGAMMWLLPGDYITEAQLIDDYIGDSEVTVLVPKETS